MEQQVQQLSNINMVMKSIVQFKLSEICVCLKTCVTGKR